MPFIANNGLEMSGNSVSPRIWSPCGRGPQTVKWSWWYYCVVQCLVVVVNFTWSLSSILCRPAVRRYSRGSVLCLVNKISFHNFVPSCHCNSITGGASAVKEPGHSTVRKSSSQVTRMHFFPQKSSRPLFSCRPENTGRQRRFTFKIKQIKRSDMVTSLSVHAITEAKQ